MNKKPVLTFIILASLLLVSSSPVAQGNTASLPDPSVAQTSRTAGANILAQRSVDTAVAPAFGTLPLSFVPNAGQGNPAVKFQARSRGGILFFTPNEIVLSLPTPARAPGISGRPVAPARAPAPNGRGRPGHSRHMPTTPPATPAVVHLRFEGANPAPEVRGVERLPGIVNYFIGNDPTNWRTNLPTYAGMVYQELYPGIDLRYNGTEGVLKGTYIISPGADPSRIRWHYNGATSVCVDEATGDLLIRLSAETGAGNAGHTLTERAPVAWQSIDGRRVPVDVRYAVADDSSIGFVLGGYDPAYPLTLDPTLIYSTYLGGSDLDDAYGIAVDSAGNAYVVGRTLSTDFPTQSPWDGTFNSDYDTFVAKLNATGNALVYSTYIGGSSGDEPTGIAVDSTGNVYVTGYTGSTDFPTTTEAFSRTIRGVRDIFVAKLNTTGSALVYGTYLGGSSWEYSYGIAVDGAGNAYVAGSTASTDFPTANPLDDTLGGGSDATVTKLNAAGSALVYSTYLGGSSGDAAYGGIAVDNAGNAYATGFTQSGDFPTVNALYPTYGGVADAFVTKVYSDGSALVYSTYLGGSSTERGLDVAVDGAGNAYVTGYTQSGNFPTQNPLDNTLGGTQDAFVAKLNTAGSVLLYGTYLGGSGDETGEGIAVDSGSAYVTGHTYSSNFPTQSPLDGTLDGPSDAFVAKLNETGNALLYSTYLGGGDDDSGYSIAVDSAGDAHITGWTESTNFPTKSPLQSTKAGPTNCDQYDLSCEDAFVTKIDLGDGIPNWAFLLYLAGDNNLCGHMRRAIVNLTALGGPASNPNLTILALLDCPDSSTWRYHVQPGGRYNYTDMGEENMGDPLTLIGFIDWARDNYPAKHYYLAVADHGRGTTGIAWDDTSGSDEFITVRQLRLVLDNVTDGGTEPLDVVHYDACLMGMLENAYQIRDYADYLVASENLGLSIFAYHLYAPHVTSGTTPEQLATAVANEYHNELVGRSGHPYTISALNLGQTGAVEDAVTALAAALRASLSANKYYVSNTRDATQKFDSRDYYAIDNNDEYLDLYDFARLIEQNVPDNNVKNAAQGVMDAVNTLVLVEHHKSDYYWEDSSYWDLNNAHGVSIYFPPTSRGWDYDPYMSHIFSFTADGQWDEFLEDYFGLMGLPPETPVDPGLPPMLSVTCVYLPIVIR